jgi:hypothetical protein
MSIKTKASGNKHESQYYHLQNENLETNRKGKQANNNEKSLLISNLRAFTS